MLGISLTVAVITNAINTVVSWWALRYMDTSVDELTEPGRDPSLREVLSVFGQLFAGLGIATVITLLGTLVATAMLTVVVSRAVIGQGMTAQEAWRDAKPRLLRLLGLTLLLPLIAFGVMVGGAVPGGAVLLAGADTVAAILLVVGIIASFVVMVWLMIRFSLAAPALMLERQSVVRALSRSAKLVRGSWWRIMGILLLSTILVWVISMIVNIPFAVASVVLSGGTGGLLGGTAESLSMAGLIISGIGGAVESTITFPISAGVTTLLYIDQRIRREALDLDLARAAGCVFPGTAQSPETAPKPPGPRTPGPGYGNNPGY